MAALVGADALRESLHPSRQARCLGACPTAHVTASRVGQGWRPGIEPPILWGALDERDTPLQSRQREPPLLVVTGCDRTGFVDGVLPLRRPHVCDITLPDLIL